MLGTIGKNLGFKTGGAAKNAFTSLRTKYVKQKKSLEDSKRSGQDEEKVIKAEKDMREYLFLSWLDNFVYKKKQQM